MNHLRAIVYGLGIWAFVFAVALVAFPLRGNERPLFESIMPVALVLATTLASISYFKNVKERFVTIGFCLGLIWVSVNLLVDLLLFLPPSPMQMSFPDYLKDIGVTYLLIPVITTGFGFARSQSVSSV